jgi:putative nucleotidyltransferase with HDIG domain
METADQILNKLKKIKEISTLPDVMQRIMDILADENSSSQELSREIEHDPALTAKILKVVNSAFYGFYRRIANVNEAVVILGYNEVRSIAITVSVFDVFSGKPAKTPFNRVKFWEHSIGTAVVADILRQECCRYEEGAFVAGLLHDIGKVVMDQHFPSEWTAVLNESREKGLPLIDVEREMLGISHARIGQILCDYWNLPEDLGRAIRRHHRKPTESSNLPLDGLIYAANSLAQQKKIGSGGDDYVVPLEKDTLQLIGLPPDGMERVEQMLQQRMNVIRALLGYFEE